MISKVKINDMQLHEVREVDSQKSVLKVETGWIYIFYEHSGNQKNLKSTVFVPAGQQGFPVVKTT